ncbi:MAG: SMI1/KNR4 family protein [Methylotenera sp.]|uniref:SMI1/KNR4 family protein n=1 Tax=Methylotenera sp. TaxID=2051956 RepID=UPI002717D6F0|nr:SMI1/KNR4 family protein [Methylotenera sp.]MDO9151707.1 SMI1/KNR4 family protein [Methylotenera sp.]
MSDAFSTDKLEPTGDQFHCAGAEDIARIEAAVGSKLPAAYVRFLENYGASMIGGGAGVVLDTGEELDLFTFFAASGEQGVFADLLAHDEYAPQGLVPIADDIFNNRYLLHAPSGKIFFVQYARGEVRFMEVASSFEAFINSVKLDADE